MNVLFYVFFLSFTFVLMWPLNIHASTVPLGHLSSNTVCQKNLFKIIYQVFMLLLHGTKNCATDSDKDADI